MRILAAFLTTLIWVCFNAIVFEPLKNYITQFLKRFVDFCESFLNFYGHLHSLQFQNFSMKKKRKRNLKEKAPLTWSWNESFSIYSSKMELQSNFCWMLEKVVFIRAWHLYFKLKASFAIFSQVVILHQKADKNRSLLFNNTYNYFPEFLRFIFFRSLEMNGKFLKSTFIPEVVLQNTGLYFW